MNRLTLKALLLSTITELMFGQPLAPNAKLTKAEYKKQAGLKKNATNNEVLTSLGLTYRDNGLEVEFWRVIDKFKAEKFLITE